jgi:hypothetical protein
VRRGSLAAAPGPGLPLRIFEDAGDTADAALAIGPVQQAFLDYLDALAEQREATFEIPELPEEPILLSYLVAAAIVVDIADKQRLLAAPGAALASRGVRCRRDWVTGVIEDRVVAAEIAEKAKVTAASVRYWISGERGPGNFPEPVVRRERASLYSWAEVAAWLAWAKLGEVDHIAAETAKACLIIDAAVTVRNGLRELPRHARPLVRELVA